MCVGVREIIGEYMSAGTSARMREKVRVIELTLGYWLNYKIIRAI